MTEEEREEVVRILRGLTSRVRDRGVHLARSVEILGELDFTQAMALVARDMDAIAPEIVSDTRSGLRLLQARHPLLMTAVVERVGIARRSTREPVPVSIEIKDRGDDPRHLGPEHGREDGRAEDRRAAGRSWRSPACTSPPPRALRCPCSAASTPTSGTSSRSPRTCPPSPRTSRTSCR